MFFLQMAITDSLYICPGCRITSFYTGVELGTHRFHSVDCQASHTRRYNDLVMRHMYYETEYDSDQSIDETIKKMLAENLNQFVIDVDKDKTIHVRCLQEVDKDLAQNIARFCKRFKDKNRSMSLTTFTKALIRALRKNFSL